MVGDTAMFKREVVGSTGAVYNGSFSMLVLCSLIELKSGR